MSENVLDHLKILAHNSALAPGSGVAGSQFLYPVTEASFTQHFGIYYVPSLGADGMTIAAAINARCEADFSTLAEYFGVVVSHFNVVIAPLSASHDGTGGAFHLSCDSADLYCDAKLNPVAPQFTQALVVAEAVEVFEAKQNGGWGCGASNGEGLSRVLAEELYPGVLDDFATAPTWLNGQREDWVNLTATTDRSPKANGCAVLFLFWLRYVQNFSWAQICQAPADTLAGTYYKLTGRADAFGRFKSDVERLGNAPFRGDNPFVPAL